MRRSATALLLAGALAIGALIGFVDTRPTWDDTGVTVGLLVLACLLFGAARPRLAWLWALAIGAWLPLLNILIARSFAPLAALAIAFVAAYAGALVRRALRGGTAAPPV
ncbi:MAG TPA: hypothetical protein PKK15_20535 [Kouleothrix sp.]|uniref:hypothetical protein n=1 Tax=Kouleothrix sp. TaxID=2779161 RepID=UPI002D0EE348|nr:hypothetical protein [Kouleothrix sp.]